MYTSIAGPQIAVTLAPLNHAQVANAQPIRPVEGLDQKRTPSQNSRVGPSVTSTFLPAISCGESARRAARKISGNFASLPRPSSPQAVSPMSGLTIIAPRFCRICTFSLVAGCAHILGFMAGAIISGPAKARACAESISEAAPRASLAMAFAEAGAIIIAPSFIPGSRWANTSEPVSNISP